MPRVVWKGAISFGLVNVPVSLYPASQEIGIDFDWLDRRSMDPVGYKRINKRTGREIESDDIVRGMKQADGDYVVLGDEEIRAAYPVSTQTIEIETFVQAGEIPFTYLEKPYILAPGARAEKVYALLREAMLSAGVVGVARVVMHAKEHLAALIPDGDALLLNTIRWASEIRPRDDLGLPARRQGCGEARGGRAEDGHAADRQHDRAVAAGDYADRFTDAIRALAAKRIAAGKTEKVSPLEEVAPKTKGNVVDLTKCSSGAWTRGWRRRRRRRPAKGTSEEKAARKETAPKKAALKKAAPKIAVGKPASKAAKAAKAAKTARRAA